MRHFQMACRCPARTHDLAGAPEVREIRGFVIVDPTGVRIGKIKILTRHLGRMLSGESAVGLLQKVARLAWFGGCQYQALATSNRDSFS